MDDTSQNRKADSRPINIAQDLTDGGKPDASTKSPNPVPAGLPQPRPGQPESKIDYGAEATNPAIRAARFDSQTTPKGAPLDPLYQDAPDENGKNGKLYNDR
ncbi:MAG TPA: hypothetical protein VK183_13350 [Flavobacterium sp.]|nr:hypothetical protein [Flavobacterium sp.]